MRRLALALLAILMPVQAGAAELTVDALWAALASGGHVALMRHALAPGVGDPEEFRLGDCSTQRNLSHEGRTEARRIGGVFRANGIARARVLSSEWCRCRETAELLGIGPVEPFPALNSLHGNRRDGPARSEAVRRAIMAAAPDAVTVMVTHQANIRPLTGTGAGSGDIVVLRPRPEGFDVLGTIPARR